MEEEIKKIEELNNLLTGEAKEIYSQSLENLIAGYKQLEEENKNCKKEYHSLVNKIENKIDKFDYEFEKAKRKNDKDRADYYWDLIRNFIKLLREE